MILRALSPRWRSRWDEFVKRHPAGSFYHLSAWQDIFAENCGRETRYLMVEDHGEIKGILPLVSFRSRLFGSFMVSLPWTNYGGLLTESAEASRILVSEMVNLARRDKAKYVELHSVTETPEPLVGAQLKVSLRLALETEPAKLWKAFPAKLRSQVRRPKKDGMYAVLGGIEKADDFYAVFSSNMRDLGTPVFPRRFFQRVLETFKDNTTVACVYAGERPVAAGFLIGFKDHLEIPWASSLRAFNRQSPNMLLYWTSLRHGCKANYRWFDFGRSTPNGSHHRFKAQWGAKPVSLTWHYWRSKDGPVRRELSPDNPKYRLVKALWRRIPVHMAQTIGPVLARNIP